MSSIGAVVDKEAPMVRAKYIRGTLAEQFWPKVKKTRGCWEWTAATFTTGYGMIRVDGVLKRAHRVAYELEVGPIPEGFHIDHLCDNRLCVRPSHLEAVTQQENNRRMAERGRHGMTLRTHCPSGHPYDESNTKVYRGMRYCLTCQRGGRTT